MYNFQKVAAILADYGFTCMWLNNDWQGADVTGVHADGVTDSKVQLEGRLDFAKQDVSEEIYGCSIDGSDADVYAHDKLVAIVEPKIADKGWQEKGTWSTSRLS